MFDIQILYIDWYRRSNPSRQSEDFWLHGRRNISSRFINLAQDPCRQSGLTIIPSRQNTKKKRGKIRKKQVCKCKHFYARTIRRLKVKMEITNLDKMVKLFDFHESRSVLIVNHEAKLEHVGHAKTTKSTHRLDELAASSQNQHADKCNELWS